MKVLLIVLAALGWCASAKKELHGQELVDYINSMDLSWKASLSPRFANSNEQDIKSMLGYVPKPGAFESLKKVDHSAFNGELPKEFDSKKNWPKCKKVISVIRDQSNCGSCWAESTVAAITDRLCIASNGKHQESLSGWNLLSCCDTCGYGCDGGDMTRAYKHYIENGLVTGGEYHSNKGCQPYDFPKCAHHINSTHYKPCGPKEFKTPKCSEKCTNKKYKTPYEEDIHYGKDTFTVDPNEEEIRKEIYQNGPVVASMTVYEDFLHYKTGVYKHLPEAQVKGLHAVRVVGWGEEGGKPYWLVANSWNEEWGDHGYIKIHRGNDESGIEDGIVAGLPKV